jgi:hypothetical protein
MEEGLFGQLEESSRLQSLTNNSVLPVRIKGFLFLSGRPARVLQTLARRLSSCQPAERSWPSSDADGKAAIRTASVSRVAPRPRGKFESYQKKRNDRMPVVDYTRIATGCRLLFSSQ